MEEYEYSFKVDSIKPYIDYCERNSYKKSINVQNRIVYENIHNRNIIARITKTINNDDEITTFDCKNVGETKENLKISRESMPLIVTEEIKEIINSFLEVLDFEEKSNLNRTRYIYEKNNVKFEIDEYTLPLMNVVGIEGEKNNVDRIYNEIKLKNNCDIK